MNMSTGPLFHREGRHQFVCLDSQGEPAGFHPAGMLAVSEYYEN